MSAEKSKPLTPLDYSENIGAAESGDARAQNIVGRCFLNGIGVEKNLEQALRWYSLSAEQSFAFAQHNKALCLLNGWGCKQDESQGRHWLAKSADQGDADSQYTYALLLIRGGGGPADEVEARRYARAAAEQELTKAQFLLGALLFDGKGGETETGPALVWLKRAADGGSAGAMMVLGNAYDAGKAVARDTAEAIRWYEKAAALDHRGASAALGALYESGRGVTVDLAKAFEYYLKAAPGDSAFVHMRLGLCYRYGRGTPISMPSAHEHFKRAHALGASGAYLQMWSTKKLGARHVALVAILFVAFAALIMYVGSLISNLWPNYGRLVAFTLLALVWPILFGSIIARSRRRLQFRLSDLYLATFAAFAGVLSTGRIAGALSRPQLQESHYAVTIWITILVALVQYSGSAYALWLLQTWRPELAAGRWRWMAILGGSLVGLIMVGYSFALANAQI